MFLPGWAARLALNNLRCWEYFVQASGPAVQDSSGFWIWKRSKNGSTAAWNQLRCKRSDVVEAVRRCLEKSTKTSKHHRYYWIIVLVREEHTASLPTVTQRLYCIYYTINRTTVRMKKNHVSVHFLRVWMSVVKKQLLVSNREEGADSQSPSDPNTGSTAPPTARGWLGGFVLGLNLNPESEVQIHWNQLQVVHFAAQWVR